MTVSISNMAQVWMSNTNTYNAIAMSVSTMGHGASANSSLLVFNVDGDQKFRVDAVGRVRIPYQSMAQIRNNVAYAAPASHTEMIHTEVPINVGSCYSTSTGRFTAAVAGYYEVWTSIHAQPSQGNRHMLYKNGSHVIGVGGEATSSGGDWHNSSILYKLYLNVNDYISIWIHSGNYCHADGNWGGWGVRLIG